MDRDAVYECWAPTGARWTNWVKPVLFAYMPDDPGEGIAAPLMHVSLRSITPPGEPHANGLHPYRDAEVSHHGVAVIVDLPGVESVAAGLALAAIGYCPVPLYNALPGPKRLASPTDAYLSSFVDVKPIMAALIAGAPKLRDQKLPPSSPPAFLLDANRLRGRPVIERERFDNRSVCAWTDFPSVARLTQSGIGRVVLQREHGEPTHWDTADVLRRWREGGIVAFVQTPTSVDPPAMFRDETSWLDRARHWLTRSQLQLHERQGGYGGWSRAAG